MAHQWTDLQRKLVAALRSGEYRQTTGVLFDGIGYCCLGVAYRVLHGKDPEAGEGFLNDYAAFGLRGRGGRFVGFVGSLAGANDTGATFTDIADFIEANPEAVFVQGL